MAGIRPQGTVPGMLDPRRLRTELDAMKAPRARRGDDASVLDRAAELDRRQRELAGRRDGARAEVKRLSLDVRTARREGDGARAEQAVHESRALGEEEKKLTAEVDAVAGELRDLLLTVANLPAAGGPDGTSPDDNVVLLV